MFARSLTSSVTSALSSYITPTSDPTACNTNPPISRVSKQNRKNRETNQKFIDSLVNQISEIDQKVWRRFFPFFRPISWADFLNVICISSQWASFMRETLVCGTDIISVHSSVQVVTSRSSMKSFSRSHWCGMLHLFLGWVPEEAPGFARDSVITRQRNSKKFWEHWCVLNELRCKCERDTVYFSKAKFA